MHATDCSDRVLQVCNRQLRNDLIASLDLELAGLSIRRNFCRSPV